MPEELRTLCRVDDIPENGAKGFRARTAHSPAWSRCARATGLCLRKCLSAYRHAAGLDAGPVPVGRWAPPDLRHARCRVHNRHGDVYLRPVPRRPIDAGQCCGPRRGYPDRARRLKSRLPGATGKLTRQARKQSVADDAPTHEQVFPVPADFAQTAHVNAAGYQAGLRAGGHPIRTPTGRRKPSAIAWMTFPTKIKNTSFTGDVSIKWFEDGVLNASVSCLDRHLAERGRRHRDHLGRRRSRRQPPRDLPGTA